MLRTQRRVGRGDLRILDDSYVDAIVQSDREQGEFRAMCELVVKA